MNGTAFDYTFKLNDFTSQTTYTAITSISGGGTITSGSFSYGGMFSPIGNFNKFIYVSFDNMYNGNDEDETEHFHETMTTLPTNYITFAQDDAFVKGVDIGYTISEGLTYTSMGGSQTGSTFTITSVAEGMDGPYPIKTVTGTFSCKLYNQDNAADVINVTNGTYKIVMTDNH
ncbi:hypothetical protein [Flavobacterium sp.]|uniref:hypothetical protein n=1 Tax=Flavobacterium sp. TaxID=239 RepID=UPI0039E4D4F2